MGLELPLALLTHNGAQMCRENGVAIVASLTTHDRIVILHHASDRIVLSEARNWLVIAYEASN